MRFVIAGTLTWTILTQPCPVLARDIDPCWQGPAYYFSGVTQTVAPTQRLPIRFSRDYALPQPAPPSAEPIIPGPMKPPVDEPAKPRAEPGPPPTPAKPENQPRVIESRVPAKPESAPKDFDSYYMASTPGEVAPPADRCLVSFWNLAPRPVSIRVDGRVHTLAPARELRLELPRQFQWQLDNRDPALTEIPAQHKGVEIVIRR